MDRKVKKKLFNNLNVQCITDNKTFWNVLKPYFTNKSTKKEKIALVEENKVIITKKTVAEKLHSCFETIVESLHLENKA